MREPTADVNAKPPPVGGMAAANGAASIDTNAHSIHPLPPIVKHFPNELKALAQMAHDAGDYETFWTLRRRYLLAQAAAYAQGRRS